MTFAGSRLPRRARLLLLAAVGTAGGCGGGGGGERGAAPVGFVVRARDGAGATELHRAVLDGGVATVVPNTSGADLDTPCGDGRYVMSRTATGALSAVRTTDGTVVFTSPPTVAPLAAAPLFGWFPGQPTNLFFAHETAVGIPAQVVADADIGGATHLHLRNLPAGFVLRDVVVSPDGSRALLRMANGAASRCDVISTSTGALVGGDLPVLPGGPDAPMPRWLPDTSGLTYVHRGVASTVYRIDPDGGGVAVLYTAPGALFDAAVAPGFTAVDAAVGRIAFVREGGGDTVVLGVDVVMGGALAEADLPADVDVVELAWHPGGATVWCQAVPTSGPAFTRVFDGATAVTRRTIVAPLGALDVDRVHGDVLLWIESDAQDPEFPASGLWRLAADGSGGTPVPLGAGLVPAGPPRFLTSWRTAAAGASSPAVR